MGVVNNIRHDEFPKQGRWLGARVLVYFNYDTAHELPGVIVRDDRESPGETIIKLDDGRYVRAAECQYAMMPFARN